MRVMRPFHKGIHLEEKKAIRILHLCVTRRLLGGEDIILRGSGELNSDGEWSEQLSEILVGGYCFFCLSGMAFYFMAFVMMYW